jgi:hypothetical protein
MYHKTPQKDAHNTSQTIDDLQSILDESQHFVNDMNSLPMQSPAKVNGTPKFKPSPGQFTGASPSKFSEEEKHMLKNRIKAMLQEEKINESNESINSNTSSPKTLKQKNLAIMEQLLKEIKPETPNKSLQKQIAMRRTEIMKATPSPRRDRILLSSPSPSKSPLMQEHHGEPLELDEYDDQPVSPSKKYLEAREHRRAVKASPSTPSQQLDKELNQLRTSIEARKIAQVISIDDSVNKMLQLGSDSQEIRDCVDKVRQCVEKCNNAALELELDVNKLHRAKEAMHNAIYSYNQFIIQERKQGRKTDPKLSKNINDDLDKIENRELIRLSEQAKNIVKSLQELLAQSHMN